MSDYHRKQLIIAFIIWEHENGNKINNKDLGTIAKMFLKDFDKNLRKIENDE